MWHELAVHFSKAVDVPEACALRRRCSAEASTFFPARGQSRYAMQVRVCLLYAKRQYVHGVKNVMQIVRPT